MTKRKSRKNGGHVQGLSPEILERRKNVILLWAKNVSVKDISEEIFGSTDSKYLARIYRDLNAEIKMSDEELTEWGKNMRVELLKKLGVAETQAWEILQKKSGQDAVKLGAIRTLKELYKEMRDIAQSSGFMPKVAEQVDQTIQLNVRWKDKKDGKGSSG